MDSQNKCLCVCNLCCCRNNNQSVPNTTLQTNWTANTTEANWATFIQACFNSPYFNPYLNPFYPLANIPQLPPSDSLHPTASEGNDEAAATQEPESPVTVSTDNEDVSSRTKRARTIFTPEQLLGLENRFAVQMHLNHYDVLDLARDLGLNPSKVKTWFRNRRSKLRTSMKRDFCRGRNLKIARATGGVVDLQNEGMVDAEITTSSVTI